MEHETLAVKFCSLLWKTLSYTCIKKYIVWTLELSGHILFRFYELQEVIFFLREAAKNKFPNFFGLKEPYLFYFYSIFRLFSLFQRLYDQIFISSYFTEYPMIQNTLHTMVVKPGERGESRHQPEGSHHERSNGKLFFFLRGWSQVSFKCSLIVLGGGVTFSHVSVLPYLLIKKFNF